MNRQSPRRALAGATFVAAAAAAAHLWYIRADAFTPSWDDAWYLEESLRLHDAFLQGPKAFVDAYVHMFRFKAPLLSVLAAPFFAFGRSAAAALAVNTVMVAAAGIYAFLLASSLFGAGAGLLACVIVETMPLLYGLSRQFMVECALTTAVLAWVFHLVASDGLRKRPHATALGILLGAGLLLKVLFPLFIAAPTAYWLWQRLRGASSRERAKSRSGAMRVVVIGAPIALSWYAFNWPYVLAFAYSAGFGAVASHYAGGGWSFLSSLTYLRALASEGVGAYYAVAALFAGAALLRTIGTRSILERAAESERTMLLAAWLLPLAVFVFGRNKELRFVAPLLPAVAVALAAALDRLHLRPWKPALLAAFFAYPADAFVRATFGASVLPHRPLAYALPPRADEDWKQRELVDWAAAGMPGGGDLPVIAVALEHPKLNANNLSYFSALRGRQTRYVNLGHAQDSVQAALIRVREKGADAVLVVSGVPPESLPADFNRVNDELMRLLDGGGLEFTRARAIELGGGRSAVLYARPQN
ncbi:MAG: glycosyltransferase family 39 protein [Elusimicrobia bacterium]|nr:glycosyltransferase family 39 protein [Elusimicrobiota bacterium]